MWSKTFDETYVQKNFFKLRLSSIFLIFQFSRQLDLHFAILSNSVAFILDRFCFDKQTKVLRLVFSEFVDKCLHTNPSKMLICFDC